MDDLWMRNDRPIPAAYWLTAAIASFVVMFCYASTWWFPGEAVDFVTPFMGRTVFAPAFLMLLAGSALGLLVVGACWVALRWAWVAIALVLLPLVPSLVSDTPVHFGVFVGLGAVALGASWRQAIASVVAVGIALVVLAGWLISGQDMAAPLHATVRLSATDATAVGVLYALAFLVVLGVALLLRRSCEREIERRSLAARAGEVEEQSAVVQERSRLARDLHDVVAHHVSLIAVRAETAPYTHPDLGEPARGVLADIAGDARLALDELRGVLGILGRSGEAERAPQPTWSDITALVERTRSAGVDVELVGDAGAEVNPSSGYAAYRVVQEALTNARKHAPGARVTVDLEVTSQLLTVLVSTPLSASPAPSQGSGQGLAGMRERVDALGGRLLSGPVGEDFVVEAILPRVVAQVPA